MGLRFVDDKYFREGTVLAFDAYFTNSSVEISDISYPLGSVITEFLNYDERGYTEAISRVETCREKNDIEGFLNFYRQALELAKQMPLYKDLLVDRTFFEPPLIQGSKSLKEDDYDVMQENNSIMIKSMRAFTDLRDDLISIKSNYVRLLGRMNGEMQKVNPSEKYEKAIAVPLVEEYLSGSVLEPPREEDPAGAYMKFIVRQSISTGGMEINERRIFNRLLSFIYLDFCKALMNQNIPKRCKNCGRYFLIENGFKNEYCTNPLENNPRKTCRDVGAASSFKSKLENPAWAIQQRAYKKYYARFMKGKMSKDEFEKWARNSERLRDETLAGKVGIDELTAKINKTL